MKMQKLELEMMKQSLFKLKQLFNIKQFLILRPIFILFYLKNKQISNTADTSYLKFIVVLLKTAFDK